VSPKKVPPIARAGLTVGVLSLLLLLALMVFAPGERALGAAPAYFQTAYPVFTPVAPTVDTGYPGPGQPTQVLSTATATQPGLFLPTSTPRPGGTGAPNLFLTEDAQIGDSQVTPDANQTFSPTRTLTATSTATVTATVALSPSAEVPQSAGVEGDDNPFQWHLFGFGLALPVVLLAFGVLVITIYRAAHQVT
jgi:hypothetical protein